MPAAPLPMRVVAAILVVVGALYVARGSYFLFTSSGDFSLRWTEQHYVFRGKGPAEVWEHQDALTRGVPVPARSLHATLEPDLGKTDGAYPPWAYVTGAAFTWPSNMEAARVLYGVINLAVLAWLLRWAFGCAAGAGSLPGWFLAASVLATSSICTTLGLGQYGVLVLAALAGTIVSAERGRWLVAGLLLGIALTKVTLAAPFVVPLLFGKHFKTVATAGAYVACASVVIWLQVGTDPLTLLLAMFSAAEHFAQGGYSMVDLLVLLGMDTLPAMVVAALGTVVISSAVMWSTRHSSLLMQFALAGVASRLWTYHTLCDNLIVVFLLMALGTQALHSKSARLAFVVTGLTLWPPGQACDFEWFRAFQLSAWIACSAVLVLRLRELAQEQPGAAAITNPVHAVANPG